jgi:hypothetical protein
MVMMNYMDRMEMTFLKEEEVQIILTVEMVLM